MSRFRRNINLPLVILCLLSFMGNVSAQNGCIEEVRDALQKMNTLPDFEKGEGAILEYEVVTKKLINGVVKPFVNSSKIKFGKDKVYALADNNVIYQDIQSMVSIIEENKSIYITPKQLYQNPELLFKQVAIVHDSILNHVTVKSCEGEGERDIHLEVDPDLRDLLGISNMKFTIDNDTGDIRHIGLVYRKGNLMEVDIIIKEVKIISSIVPFEGGAVGKVIAQDGKLKKEFANYKLIDLR